MKTFWKAAPWIGKVLMLLSMAIFIMISIQPLAHPAANAAAQGIAFTSSVGSTVFRVWSIIVHHRIPGRSVLKLMISLCPACHAQIHKTRVVLSAMSPLLLELWREQHPQGHEQTRLNFQVRGPAAEAVRLFTETKEKKATREV